MILTIFTSVASFFEKPVSRTRPLFLTSKHWVSEGEHTAWHHIDIQRLAEKNHHKTKLIKRNSYKITCLFLPRIHARCNLLICNNIFRTKRFVLWVLSQRYNTTSNSFGNCMLFSVEVWQLFVIQLAFFEVRERENDKFVLDFASTRNILLFLQSFTAENNENVSHKYLHALNDTCTHTNNIWDNFCVHIFTHFYWNAGK